LGWTLGELFAVPAGVVWRLGVKRTLGSRRVRLRDVTLTTRALASSSRIALLALRAALSGLSMISPMRSMAFAA
jgi:hypothetical protein